MPDELNDMRDRLAELCGWQYRRCVCEICNNLSDDDASGWVSGDPDRAGLSPAHPFPEGDLTTLVAAWPEGWYLSIEVWHDGKAMASGGRDEASTFSSGVVDTEYEARLRLTVAVLGKETP
jgi:hypothetical protein